MSLHKGFILTAGWEDSHGTHHIKFHGVSNQGPFELVFNQSKPVFFIESDVEIPPNFPPCERKHVNLKNFSGKKVEALYFSTQKSLYEGKDALTKKGVRTFEADVRSPERFLMERFIYGSVDFKGESQDFRGMKTFLNPQIRRGDYTPEFNIMSLDIETGRNGDLYSIAFHQKGPQGEIKKVFMVGDQRKEVDEILSLYPNEEEVILEFFDEFHQMDPDILVGWHVIGFDLLFLERKFHKYDIPFSFGRGKSKLIVQEKKGSGYFANMPGRLVIDGPQSLRSAFFSYENFKLDTVAKEVLGVGKDINSSNSDDKVEEIERRFREDKEALAKYNLLDCTLVLDIFEKTKLINLMYTRTKISGLLMDKLGISTGAFDHFMLPQVHRKGLVAPNVIDMVRDQQSAGGLVIEPKVGIHDYVIVLDFKSLYPSIIRSFNIDPISRLRSEKDPLRGPTGIAFSKTEHVLPKYIKGLMEKRAQASEQGLSNLSQAIKILMNSFYGVMGSAGSRFYHADLPTAITETGQWILKTTVRLLEEKGYEVVYGDTDSVFVKLNPEDKLKVKEVGQKLTKEINKKWREILQNDFGATSHLEMEFEKIYRKLFLPPARSGEGGAKKRYAGLLSMNGKEQLDFVGMEYVRNDWTKMAKKFQYNLFKKLFYDEELDSFIKEFVNQVKDHIYDNDLVYKKRLTKKPKEYIKNVPPHVKAALQLEANGLKVPKEIQYLITQRGPIPVQLKPTDINYEHYVERQIKPLANNVLFLFDKSFDEIVTGDQLALF